MVNTMAKLPKPKVSPRMQFFVDEADPGMPFWDFCCDHGYIGIAALLSNKFTAVHFVDQIPHIIDRLKKLFAQSPEKNLYPNYFFHDNGGENLDCEIEGNIIIAGVGGRTIISILQAIIKKNHLKAKKIILSPHLDIKMMEEFCLEQLENYHYQLLKKVEINENNRIRPVYIWTKLNT